MSQVFKYSNRRNFNKALRMIGIYVREGNATLQKAEIDEKNMIIKIPESERLNS